jgi:hypothetical protein
MAWRDKKLQKAFNTSNTGACCNISKALKLEKQKLIGLLLKFCSRDASSRRSKQSSMISLNHHVTVNSMIKTFSYCLLLITSMPLTALGQATSLQFDFSNGEVKKSFVHVTAYSVDTKTKGFGFLYMEGLYDYHYQGLNHWTTDFITSNHR